MDEDENIRKNLKHLDDLAKDEKYVDIRVCLECKSPKLEILGIPPLYSPLSPVRARCRSGNNQD